MKTTLITPEAFREWLDLIDAGDLSDAALGRLNALEQRLLRSTPSNAAEAVALLEVLLENVKAGARSDGLDVDAIRSLQAWIGRDLSSGSRGPRALALAAAA